MTFRPSGAQSALKAMIPPNRVDQQAPVQIGGGPRLSRGHIVLTFAALVIVPALVGFRLALSPSTLPVDRLLSDNGWADETRCAECHEQALTFWDTGHANTLRPAGTPTSIALLSLLSQHPTSTQEGTELIIGDEQVLALNTDGGFQSRTNLDWCFGSGTHACTWVARLDDSYGATDLLEYRWTWYSQTESFDVTPGQPIEPTPGYFGRMGVLFDHPKARRCFGCHASVVPVDDGAIQEFAIHAGVTCQRCHGPRGEHVTSEGEIHDPIWSTLTQQESVQRCAECHRSLEEFEPTDIETGNPDIVRFQPVGLTQSLCFQQSNMTCTTCHDPHQTLAAQDSMRISQCVQCHDGAETSRPLCAAGQVDQCVDCHMPKVAMERPLQFTDHWIRVPDGEPSP